jgi:GDP-L-fucose synthase
MSYWKGKRVLVTGGAGFVGSHLVQLLLKEGASVRITDNLENSSTANLGSILDHVEFLELDLTELESSKKAVRGIQVVLNLAAKVGGVGYNLQHPGQMLTHNLLLSTMVLEAARQADVERFLCVSSACVYPRYCTMPIPETEGFRDLPEASNLGYGWAKRTAEMQAQLYAQEHGMKVAIVRPYNTYGPRDHFELERAHVIPALIKKVLDNQDPVVVWGDGDQTRAFVYVEDLVTGMLLATEKYPEADPLNIGTEEEISVRDLVKLICEESDRSPQIIFDSSKPSGQPRRNADITKAKRLIGYYPRISLREGIKRTLQWYRETTAAS